mmetsp:Transcript_125701/g.367247  ORF Transcript_125701/g.367247 Transcript_125701/m.367247 type:complete len:169 (-) Transcript_125701:237-743(-)
MAYISIVALLLLVPVMHSWGARHDMSTRAALDAASTPTATQEVTPPSDAAAEEVHSGCTPEDQSAMFDAGSGNQKGSFGETAASCGPGAVTWKMTWNSDNYVSCLTKKAQLTPGCAECFSAAGLYGFNNCKVACMRSWCSKGCQDCSKGHAEQLHACVGFAPPEVGTC